MSPSTRARRSSRSTPAPSTGRPSSRATSSTPRPVFSPHRRSGAVLVGEETYIGTRGVHRVPARPACRGEGKGGSGAGVARPSSHLGHRGAARRAGSDDRPRPRARRAHRHLGARRRRGEEPLRHRVRTGRASASRESRSNSRSSWRDRGARDPWPLDPVRRCEPLQRVRSAGQADRADLRQRRRHRSRERSSPMRSPRSQGPRRPRSTRRISRCSSASKEESA